jgi:predicted  nucleic acid-binding Zn-ribbon protein
VEILLKGFQCRRCGHQWKPGKEGVPAKCPSCDSPHWQRPRGEGLAAHLAEVFQLYEVPDDQRDKIIAYVQQYPGVAHALRKAVPELERVFGQTRRRLDIEVDPESGWEGLLAWSYSRNTLKTRLNCYIILTSGSCKLPPRFE